MLEGSRQRPAPLVLLLRGLAKGESTARLARELGMSRQQVTTLRQRIQVNVNDSALTDPMKGHVFEVDEVYQNAGKKSTPHRHPADPPRRRANNRRGHGTYETDRSPILHLIRRETGEARYWVVGHADGTTCQGIIAEAVPAEATIVYADAGRSYRGMAPTHGTVAHGRGKWARDADGDGVREVHCNTCEGAGTGLRNFLRTFRGVHTAYLQYYVAMYEALVNAKHVTPALIGRMCWMPLLVHDYWT